MGTCGRCAAAVSSFVLALNLHAPVAAAAGSGTIKLIYNSPTALDCANPDNLTVTPRGGLLMCEDNSGATTNDAERLIGLS